MSVKGIKIWLILATCAAILFGVSLVVTATVMSKDSDLNEKRATVYRNSLENFYEQSFYELMDSVNNMEVNLSKLAVSGSSKTQQTLLSKLSMQSAAAQSSAAALPIYSDNMSDTVKFINQVGDYSISLNKKLTQGSALTKEDRSILRELHSTVLRLKNNISALYEKIGESSFSKILESENAENFFVGSGFAASNSEEPFEYPKLIYDGPFSDSVENTLGLKLTGETYSVEQLKGRLFSMMKDFSPRSVEYVATIEKDFKVYAFNVLCDNDETYSVHLSETGGFVSQMNSYLMRQDSESEPVQMETAQCLDLAEAFATKLGFEVKPVWVSKTLDGYVYVNLCPVIGNQVIIYPDLVKITVDAVRGKIVGVEAMAYLLNHSQREVASPSISVETASEKVDSSLTVEKITLTLIPLNSDEVLCYEFKCSDGENEYFVYIDAQTGEEAELFRVIRGTEGYTVI